MFCFCLYVLRFYVHIYYIMFSLKVMYHIARSWIVHYPNYT